MPPDLFTEKATAVWREIDRARRILLTFHPQPDLDSVGSCLGLAAALRQLGHAATVIRGDSPLPDFLSYLPGGETVVPKGLWEIRPEDFDLLLVLDLSQTERLTERTGFTVPSAWKTVCLDHHQRADLPAAASLIDAEAAATAVLVYDLLKFRKVAFNYDIAANLLIGIYGDTGSYRYARVDAALMTRVADLLQFVPDYPKLIFQLENNLSPEALKFEALALSRIEVKGQLAVAAVSFEDLTAAGIKPEFIQSSIANKLKSVRGWNIGASLIEVEPNLVSLSLRTRDSVAYDLSRLAAALGGGGHAAAAGATLKTSLAGAKNCLIKTIREIYPEVIGLS